MRPPPTIYPFPVSARAVANFDFFLMCVITALKIYYNIYRLRDRTGQILHTKRCILIRSEVDLSIAEISMRCALRAIKREIEACVWMDGLAQVIIDFIRVMNGFVLYANARF